MSKGPDSGANDTADNIAMTTADGEQQQNFIRDIVATDVAAGKHDGRVVTRFPPEPNGYLHIGHAKSMHLNFSLAREFAGVCHLRFDDTNPETENEEYVASIERDVRWMGFDWDGWLFFASDHFERMYQDAIGLIERGKAYVCDLSLEEVRQYRGTVSEPGTESPYRNRSVEENLDLFRRMRAGEFPDGSRTLRAKIDMAAPNMKMRDPPLYRIRQAHHYRQGDAWPIYPMYDYAHCLSDAYEGITHSLCTLEFENNRELYDWIIAATEVPHQPRQYEFARLNLSYTVMSKRKLALLVQQGYVNGWDDPRMPTIAGLRRRGVTPEAIRDFCHRIGVAKANSTVDLALLEHSVREDLNHKAPRVMAVLRPLKVVIENYPEGQSEQLDASYWPHDVPKEGSRPVPFGRELYIERDDFMENPPKKYHRLAPGREVRLRYAYFIKCERVVKNAAGEVVELRCTYDPETRGGKAPDGRKVKGTLHWVAAEQAIDAEVRVYDRLFAHPKPDQTDADFLTHLNPESLLVHQAKLEPSLAAAEPEARFQFERQGYFFVDPDASTPGKPVFNRIVALKDSWAKISAQQQSQQGKEKPPTEARQTPATAGAAGTGSARSAQPRDDSRPERKPAGLSEAQQKVADALVAEHALPPDDAETLASRALLQQLFWDAVAQGAAARPVANLLVNEVVRDLKERQTTSLPFDGVALGRLVQLLEAGTISTRGAKQVLAVMLAEGGDPEAVVKSQGLEQLRDTDAIAALVTRVLADNPQAVAKYKAGKTNVAGFLLGQVIKASAGRADPQQARKLLERQLANG